MEENLIILSSINDRWDKDLSITLSRDQKLPDVLHVFLKGRIDAYNAEFFQDRLNKIYLHGFVRLVFRCSSLDYVASAGLGVFASEYQKFTQKGGLFVFFGLQPKVLDVFQILGFAKLFCIAKELKDVDYFLNNADKTQKKVFPLSFCCPICDKRLNTTKSGRFRCANCRTIISVSETGEVSF